MHSRDALYNWLQELIDNAADDTPLKDAVLFRNLRGSVDEAKKVIRVDCYGGEMAFTNFPSDEEFDVDFIIQFFVTPDTAGDNETEIGKLDQAKDLSFQMMRTVFRSMKTEVNWSGIKDADGSEWENTEESLGTVMRAVTYFFGKVNPY